MNINLTKGPVMGSMLHFAVPMILGNLMQQCYNIADTLIVGKYLGANALAAVGSSFTLMTFLTSILLGLCMGSGAVFSIRFGQRDEQGLQDGICGSFILIAVLTAVLNIAAFCSLNQIRFLLQVPEEVWGIMREYLSVIFGGITATFFYNYFASFLRAIGNSMVPLIFLAVSAVLNIALDLWFVLGIHRGASGAAEATVISQYISGIGIAVYAIVKCPQLRTDRSHWHVRLSCIREIAGFSVLTCIQQSVMNFGILMVKGLVNSFGPAVMAAFAAAVKIDTFAYLPVQDFGNAYSTFTAQNYGAGNHERIRRGTKDAFALSAAFSIVISLLVNLFAHPLMQIFVKASEMEVIAIGVQYLRLEGSFYLGIGWLFLLYGYYRAVKRAEMSVVLTVISLGMRVALAYLFSATALGVDGIWIAIPIGWALADMTGLFFLRRAFRSQKPA